MWRTYFALETTAQNSWESLSDTTRKKYAICQHVFLSDFSRSDQDILRMYFTSRWGDDMYAVEDYSLKKNVPTKVIWMVIKRANRAVMEEIGLLERKGEEYNG